MEFLKQVLAKYLAQVLLLATIVGAGWLAYDLYSARKQLKVQYAELIGTRESYKQLTAYTAKLENAYRDEKTLLEHVDSTWREVLLQKDLKIKMLSDATFLMGRHIDRKNGPDYYFQTPRGTQNLIVDEIRIDGPDSPPVGFVAIKSDGTTYKGNYRFEVRVEQLQTQDPGSGKVQVFAKAFYIAQENGLAEKRRPALKKWAGVPYPLPIVGGTAEVDPTVAIQEKRFYLWAPRIVFGLNAGVQPGALFSKPMLGFSFAGKGATPRDLDWRVLQVGIDADWGLKNAGLNLTPFTIRPLPNTLVNTYLGPGIGWDAKGINYFVNLSLGF